MKGGANVPGAGDPCLEDGDGACFEFDRTRDERPKSARVFVRECDGADGAGVGDDMIEDLDRACPGGGPGEGVALLSLPNGAFRHFGLVCAWEAIPYQKQTDDANAPYTRVRVSKVAITDYHEAKRIAQKKPRECVDR